HVQLNVAEERQADIQPADRVGTLEGNRRDGRGGKAVGLNRKVQVGRERSAALQAGHKVLGLEAADEAVLLEITRQKLLVVLVIIGDEVGTEIDADPLEEVVRDRHNTQLDGNFD